MLKDLASLFSSFLDRRAPYSAHVSLAAILRRIERGGLESGLRDDEVEAAFETVRLGLAIYDPGQWDSSGRFRLTYLGRRRLADFSSRLKIDLAV